MGGSRLPTTCVRDALQGPGLRIRLCPAPLAEGGEARWSRRVRSRNGDQSSYFHKEFVRCYPGTLCHAFRKFTPATFTQDFRSCLFGLMETITVLMQVLAEQGSVNFGGARGAPAFCCCFVLGKVGVQAGKARVGAAP